MAWARTLCLLLPAGEHGFVFKNRVKLELGGQDALSPTALGAEFQGGEVWSHHFCRAGCFASRKLEEPRHPAPSLQGLAACSQVKGEPKSN